MTAKRKEEMIAKVKAELGQEKADMLREEYDLVMRRLNRNRNRGHHPGGQPANSLCSLCGFSHTGNEFFERPKCWDELQKQLRLEYSQDQEEVWEIQCSECGATFLWDTRWVTKTTRCRDCWDDNRKRRARNRYALKHKKFEYVQAGIIDVRVIVQPTCNHCGEKFQAKRNDAKFCSARCRVAANRALRHA
jgi:hypothetical protein